MTTISKTDRCLILCLFPDVVISKYVWMHVNIIIVIAHYTQPPGEFDRCLMLIKETQKVYIMLTDVYYLFILSCHVKCILQCTY